MVSSTPRPHFTPGKDPVPIVQEAGWAPGPVWTGGKSRPHEDSIPDHPARSQSLYRLSYPAHKNLYSFAILIISGIIQIDQCKVKCLLQVPWLFISTVLFYTWLLYYTKQKSYFNFASDCAIEQMKLKKEHWIACVLVCQPVVVDRGPLRDLPPKLPCDKDLQACWTHGKLHAQLHTGRVRQQYIARLVTNPIYVCPSKRLPAALPTVEACLFCIDEMTRRCKVHAALIKFQDNIIVCTTVNSHCAVRSCSPSTAISALNEAFLHPHESLLIPTTTQGIVWRQGHLVRNLFTPSCRPYWRPAIKQTEYVTLWSSDY